MKKITDYLKGKLSTLCSFYCEISGYKLYFIFCYIFSFEETVFLQEKVNLVYKYLECRGIVSLSVKSKGFVKQKRCGTIALNKKANHLHSVTPFSYGSATHYTTHSQLQPKQLGAN